MPLLSTRANASARGYGMFAGGAAVLPNSYESIATINGTGSSGTITFSSIPSTYTHLQIRCFMLSGTSDDAPYMRFNGDTGSNYYTHNVLGEGGTARVQGYNSSSSNIGGAWWGFKNGIPSVSIIDILDYQSTSKYKTSRTLSGQDNNATTYGSVALFSGLWLNTVAISSISIFLSGTASFSTTAQFALYGIKG